jgi:centrin-1
MPPHKQPPKSNKRRRTTPTASDGTSRPTEVPVASDESKETIQEAFDTYADESGTISISRTKAALREFLGIHIRTAEIRVVASCDCDERLNWNAFSKFTASKLRQQSKANAAFHLFDRDGKGLVCLEDVARVATELGESYSPDELEEMIHEADPSGEGLIDQEGFFRLVRKLNL